MARKKVVHPAVPPTRRKPSTRSETALLLLETEETDDEDETVEEAGSESISILFDDAETYQPSSLY
ncbi:hypothetical protein [Hoeflea ulvae]|uniref:Uncharacterized protein n=1 Tax=Hoeflea ulvae TaxID=2983764 RepID=A0ABT3YHF6_9HYPH|nr:hypothetical protein [Hoeflea ulvae]MCY0095247.1 hypothetical protein [Hoeflea ulvae]